MPITVACVVGYVFHPNRVLQSNHGTVACYPKARISIRGVEGDLNSASNSIEPCALCLYHRFGLTRSTVWYYGSIHNTIDNFVSILGRALLLIDWNFAPVFKTDLL